MKTYKILAAGWELFVEQSASPGSWTTVGGISSFEFGSKTNKSDVTTFDSEGFEESIITSRGKTLKIDGLMAYTKAGARDQGQAIVESFGELLGDSAFGNFKLVDPKGGVKLFEGMVTVDTIAGGGNNDSTKFSFTVDVNGQVDSQAILASAVEAGPAVTLAVNEVKDIVPEFTPINVTNKNVTVVSSAPTKVVAIAVGNIVKVFGVSAGPSTLTITTADGGEKTDTVVVTVS